jgi:hypothetical protein
MSERDDEEIRFAKKQQWYVATAAVTLIAAIFALADKIDPTTYEKVIAVAVLIAIAISGFLNLRSLQKHIVSKRPKNDQRGKRSWWKSRGADIMWTLIGIVWLSTLAIIYVIVCRL